MRVRLRGEIRGLQQRLGVTTILVTHDQEEALTMADRIVVMKDGAIEQIGTPSEVYLRPATPFVADFVGKTNLLPAERTRASAACRSARSASSATPARGDAKALRIFFRPEDVQVRGVNGATPNSAAAVVEKIEFLGAFSRITFRLNGIDQPLVADLSVNDMVEFHPKPGDTLRVALPAGPHPGLRRMSTARADRLGPRRRAVTRRHAPVAFTGPTASPTRCSSSPGWRSRSSSSRRWRRSSRRACEDRAGRLRRPRQLRAYFQTPALARSIWNSVWVSALVTVHHAPARVHLRVRAHAQLHALEGAAAQHGAGADPRALAAGGDLVHLLVRQPGRC